MTKRERVLAAIAGQPVDRPPFSLWYHFRLNPPTGPGMVAAELDFYRRYDPDLFKVMHDANYEMPADLPQVMSPNDWGKLPILDGVSGTFGAQLETLKQIIAGKSEDAPVIETVFSIHSTVQKATGKNSMAIVRQNLNAAHEGLKRLTASICNYVSALVANGIDGIYLAMSGAASDTMSEAEYRDNFLQYDQQILDAASGATVNVLHQHGGGIYPDVGLALKGFHVYCWSDRQEGNPSIREMRVRHTGCLMAGVDEVNFGTMAASDIKAQVQDALAQSGGRSFIVAPGCAVPTPPDSPDANLRAIKEAVMERHA